MKLKIIGVIVAFLLCFLQLHAQDQDEKQKNENKKEVKTGWNLGALPTITYNSDLGFQYGALSNLYYYGDGKTYPKYLYSIYGEVSRYTKGSGINRLFFDSEHLIKGVRFTADLSFLTDQANNFYGFNGYQSAYNQAWEITDDLDYKSRMFYRYERKMFRVFTDFQGKLRGDKLKWIAGISFYNFNIGSVDIEKLNEGQDEDQMLPSLDDQPGLYEKYKEWGVIPEEEAEGGFVNYIKLGLIYDTRDQQACPMSGVWTDAVLMMAPSFTGNKFDHIRVGISHRQYFTLIKDDMSVAYRVGYQQTIQGKTPFFLQNYMLGTFQPSALYEGLGSDRSIRGLLRNRVVGDGITFGNVELRWKFVRFKFIKQNFYLAINTFMDGGLVVKPIDTDLSKVPEDEHDLYFDQDKDKLHLSYGAGLKVAMNENFVISADYGIAMDKRDGSNRLYIGLNYIF